MILKKKLKNFSLKNLSLLFIILIFCVGVGFVNIGTTKTTAVFDAGGNQAIYFSKDNVGNIAPTQTENELVDAKYDNEYISVLADNAVYNSVTYNSYKKGMKNVNIMFNFINYNSDTTNNFTQNELNNIITTFREDVKLYFERMSQGFVTIEIDYVCSIAPNSYDYYLTMNDANYTLESRIFNNAVSAKKGYDGNVKNFIFNEYNFRVNAFAGNSGGWSTFLWPHAFSSSGLILMMEYKQGSSMKSATMCHEMLHTFGVGDLYSYKNNNNVGAQGLDIMATSNKNMSTNAYYRQKVGWLKESEMDDNIVTPIEKITNGFGDVNVTLHANTTSNYKNIIAYKFGEDKTTNEYFMIEYRVKNYENKFDDSIANTGVIIYRVNPKADGNSNVYDGALCEVIFMGDNSTDITKISYAKSCLLTSGQSLGSVGEKNSKSLVYSNGGGFDNIFKGKNSNIIVKVNSLSNEIADVTITFVDNRTTIDMKNVIWDYNSTFGYNGQNQKVGIINLPNELLALEGTENGIIYNGTFSATNAGKYNATISFSDYILNTYKFINNNLALQLEWEIKPANITVTIHNKSSKYGDEIVALTHSVTKGTVYNSDQLNIVLNKSSGNIVGDYEINGTFNNKNYNIAFIKGKYQITPRQVNVKILDQNISYEDDFAISQTAYELLPGGDNIIIGDNLTLEIIAENLDLNNIIPGTYALNAVSKNKNYQLIANPKGTLTVDNKIDLSMAHWDYQKPFSYNAKTKSIALVNLPKGVSAVYTGTSNAVNAGKYTVKVTLKYNSNFILINDNFEKKLNWEITPETIEILIDSLSSKYGENLKPLTYETIKFKIYGNDKVDIKLQKAGNNNAGVYEINAYCSNQNYNLISNEATYTIEKRIVHVQLNNQEFYLDKYKKPLQDEYEVVFGGDSVLNNDDLKLEIKAQITGNIKAGEYNLTATSNNKNYEVVVWNATLKIFEPIEFPLHIILIIIAIVVISVGTSLVCLIARRKRYSWINEIDY